MIVTKLNSFDIKKSIFFVIYTLYIYEVQMNKESDKDMKLIISNPVETTSDSDMVLEKTYQSDPLKIDLYSKLLAFRKSQKKFGIKDLIKDNLK